MSRAELPSPGRELAAETQTYNVVGRTLLGGLLLSITVMVLGLLLAAARRSSNASQVLPLDQVPSHLGQGSPAAVLDLGILLLFATPLVGVVLALIAFLRQRDFAFVLVSILLLIVLAIGFAVALH